MKSKLFINRLFVKLGSMAVVGVLFSLLFAVSVFAAPNTPAGLQQTGSSESSITFGWSASPGTNVYYQIQYSSDNKVWYDKHMSYHSTPSDTITGLSNGQTGYVRVRAYENRTTDYSAWSSPLQVVSKPSYVLSSKVKQTKAANTSATFTWEKSIGANRYRVTLYENGKETRTQYTNTNSITVGSLKAGNTYNFRIYPQNTIPGYTAEAYSSTSVYNIKTLPGTVKNFKLNYGYSSSKKASVTWNKITNADGYQIEVYNAKNKKIRTVSVRTYPEQTLSDITTTGFHKIRIRAFIQLNTGKKYGSWTTSYISNQPKVDGKKSGSNLKISWKKVTGATSYSVYISTKTRTGYKLAGTTKSTSFTIKKYGKSKLKLGKYYYVYVVSNKKVGSKTYKSGSNYSYSMYMSRY